ncbi:MAG: glycosyltransferase, partial [Sarcina sp.]
MKIIHIISTGCFAGAEKVVLEICKNSYKDIRPFILCKKGELEKYLIKYEIPYLVYSTKLELIRILIDQKFDIIHTHDYTASLFGGIFGRGKKIAHIHCEAPFTKKINLKNILFLSTSIFMSKIIYVSEEALNMSFFKKQLKKKAIIIKNGLNIEENIWANKEKKDIDCIFVGRLSQEKNPFEFILFVQDCIKVNSNFKAKIIGDGILKESIINYIKSKKLENNIEIVGFSDKPQYYMKRAKVILVPSSLESFGLVFLEGLINDCLPIIPNIKSLKEIFGHDYKAIYN